MNHFYPTFLKMYQNNQPAEIIYQSASGHLSHRVIYIKKVTPQFIQGYCSLRKTTRTFSLQNMLSVYPKNTHTLSKSKTSF
ncbi:hypothetical protein FZW96_15270 [Bacillus sp. BGMRC 2118]|nr:hypothetical protein FZW96_15270 [Bacillus sp. BGMRC 2118]